MGEFSEIRRLEHPKFPGMLRHLRRLHVVRKGSSGGALSKCFPLTGGNGLVTFEEKAERITQPHHVGVIFSGGQAAGGHNVIAGLYDGLKQLHPESTLLGFLQGPSGLIEDRHVRITGELVDRYRNQGGFDMIGSGRTKISTEEQFAAVIETVKKHHLDGVVIIGGDDSNTNAALLAERLKQGGVDASVVGVPKTIDGDLKGEQIEISFGFDTAAKTYSNTIGNVLRDALSAGKYYFFIKLMGRSASHIALECALQTQPNYTMIGEEIAEKGLTLSQITADLCDMICKRAQEGKNHGVVLIPEGTIEFIPEVRRLIGELNRLLATPGHDDIVGSLSKESAACFAGLPKDIQTQLIMDRDPHGNVQVTKIETERLFIHLVEEELKKRKYAGKFSVQPLFLGYEGRSGYPSCFDANYCYALGLTAALLVDAKLTGYMAAVRHLAGPAEKWRIAGVPLASMMALEERKGKQVPVIAKALVDLKGKPFQKFEKQREAWKWNDAYQYPGPVQFFGPEEVRDAITRTLQLEAQSGDTSSSMELSSKNAYLKSR